MTAPHLQKSLCLRSTNAQLRSMIHIQSPKNIKSVANSNILRIKYPCYNKQIATNEILNYLISFKKYFHHATLIFLITNHPYLLNLKKLFINEIVVVS